jgi:hypothetical protein
VLSEKRNSFSGLLKNKGFKEERTRKVGLDAIDTSTTLESNKSQLTMPCQQFEVFQSALAPDKLVVRELWDDQAALDTHAQRNATRPAAALGAGGPPR